jgi:hypothetical protein
MTPPLLIHLDLSKPFVLEIDVSNFEISAILSQLGKYNFFHPIGFCFCKFFLAEINYKIHDKEVLIIMDTFKEWCHLLEGTQHEILCIQTITTCNIS